MCLVRLPPPPSPYPLAWPLQFELGGRTFNLETEIPVACRPCSLADLSFNLKNWASPSLSVGLILRTIKFEKEVSLSLSLCGHKPIFHSKGNEVSLQS